MVALISLLSQIACGISVSGVCVCFRCSSSSGRIIGAKDHASVQISVADVNESGTVTGTSKSYAICGFIRSLVRMNATHACMHVLL